MVDVVKMRPASSVHIIKPPHRHSQSKRPKTFTAPQKQLNGESTVVGKSILTTALALTISMDGFE